MAVDMFLPGLRPAVKFGVHEVVGKLFSERVYNNAKTIANRLGFEACFAAGTPLRTPTGSVMIEAIRAGDLVLSRDEHDPDGLIVAQTVEEVFARQALVMHLHLPHGVVIRTTAEHPFYERAKGWVACQELAAGDALLCEDGTWVAVGEVFDTGCWETVYNFRVADFHTYFVGCDEWEFSVWAHNAECGQAHSTYLFGQYKNQLRAQQRIAAIRDEITQLQKVRWDDGVGPAYRRAIDDRIATLQAELTPVNQGLPSGVTVVGRQSVNFNGTSWLDAGRAIKAAHPGDLVVYRLKDTRGTDVLKVGIDKPASLPEVWRRYKNAQDGLPHRSLELEITVVRPGGLPPKSIEQSVSSAYQQHGYRLLWDNDHPMRRLGRPGPGIPYFRQSNLAKQGWQWVEQGPGLDPVYRQVRPAGP